MKLKELIAAYRSDATDQAKPYFADNETVTRWLNEAEDEACIRQKLLRERVDPSICRIAVQAGIVSYSLDPRVIDITYASMVYANNPTMQPIVLVPTTHDELDRARPQWRALTYRPDGIICLDSTIETSCIPDADYTINLEVHRLPLTPMSAAKLEVGPEINGIHHRHLVKWALFRMAEMQDAEIENKEREQKFEAQFDEYFGKRPTANMRRRQNASRPHRNRSVY